VRRVAGRPKIGRHCVPDRLLLVGRKLTVDTRKMPCTQVGRREFAAGGAVTKNIISRGDDALAHQRPRFRKILRMINSSTAPMVAETIAPTIPEPMWIFS
jgi:hypothetical protein